MYALEWRRCQERRSRVRVFARVRGGALQVDPIKTKSKRPGSKCLKLNSDIPLSNFAFNFNLRRYNQGNGSEGGGGGEGVYALDARRRDQVGGPLTTGTRPTLNLLLFFHSYVSAFPQKVGHATISVESLF